MIAVLRMKVTTGEHVRKVSLHRLLNLEHAKHQGRGICLLHGVTVKPSCKHFLSYRLAYSSFPILIPPGSVNISARTLLQFVVNLKYWYLLHVHFEGCPFLKTHICPKKTAKSLLLC